MPYIPNTGQTEAAMFADMGISGFDELIRNIPPGLRLEGDLGLEAGLSEWELESAAQALGELNRPAGRGLCFLGGGVYDHYIPKAVDFLAGRSEFYTAYTPYQAEVSQGTLQAMYEFQSMICALSGMDVANASMYDGGSALAEACSLALAATRKTRILLSGTVNPRFISVVRTYLQNRQAEIVLLPESNGITDLSRVPELIGDAACLVVQSPNYYGVLEDWRKASSSMGNSKALFIAVSDPLRLSVLAPPGECGADVYVGEGQMLGNELSFGGPYLGLLAVTDKYLRKLPGRISGKTVDSDGNEAYVLTLQTREQHIRRENATSNICTNQGLMALRAAIYMSLMGKENLPKIARLCFRKAHYAADRILESKKYSLPFGDQFLNEFVLKIESGRPAADLVLAAEKENIFIGAVQNVPDLLLLAFTEKRTRAEIDRLADFLNRA
ncbi:MAG: aminomethyl-transferring glycine dehydrogenase subunit GcvPA [FCB group bacterium]|nr:aminomethyl-transferring glycine dehydrogenase subunit GcvPA [FCB group bacterium]